MKSFSTVQTPAPNKIVTMLLFRFTKVWTGIFKGQRVANNQTNTIIICCTVFEPQFQHQSILLGPNISVQSKLPLPLWLAGLTPFSDWWSQSTYGTNFIFPKTHRNQLVHSLQCPVSWAYSRGPRFMALFFASRKSSSSSVCSDHSVVTLWWLISRILYKCPHYCTKELIMYSTQNGSSWQFYS